MNNDSTLTILAIRLANAKSRMRANEPGQRARFHGLLNAIATRRRLLSA